MNTITPLATDIMGTKVRSTEAENIGVVQNIMIDPQNGSIMYIVLCFADFMGKEHRHFAIPRELLTVQHGTNGSIFLDVDKEHLMDAEPVFNGQYPVSQIDNNHKCIYELMTEKTGFSKSFA